MENMRIQFGALEDGESICACLRKFRDRNAVGLVALYAPLKFIEKLGIYAHLQVQKNSFEAEGRNIIDNDYQL